MMHFCGYNIVFKDLANMRPFGYTDHKDKILVVNINTQIQKWRQVLCIIHELLHIWDRVHKYQTAHDLLHYTAVGLLVYFVANEHADPRLFVYNLLKIDNPLLSLKFIDSIRDILKNTLESVYGK